MNVRKNTCNLKSRDIPKLLWLYSSRIYAYEYNFNVIKNKASLG